MLHLFFYAGYKVFFLFFCLINIFYLSLLPLTNKKLSYYT